MTAALILFLQAATATPPERIDLTLPASSGGCGRESGDDVIVCGGRESVYRLLPRDDRFERPSRLKAETSLFGGAARAAVETEAVTLPGGLQSNRLMARIKLPF